MDNPGSIVTRKSSKNLLPISGDAALQSGRVGMIVVGDESVKIEGSAQVDSQSGNSKATPSIVSCFEDHIRVNGKIGKRNWVMRVIINS